MRLQSTSVLIGLGPFVVLGGKSQHSSQISLEKYAQLPVRRRQQNLVHERPDDLGGSVRVFLIASFGYVRLATADVHGTSASTLAGFSVTRTLCAGCANIELRALPGRRHRL